MAGKPALTKIMVHPVRGGGNNAGGGDLGYCRETAPGFASSCAGAEVFGAAAIFDTVLDGVAATSAGVRVQRVAAIVSKTGNSNSATAPIRFSQVWVLPLATGLSRSMAA